LGGCPSSADVRNAVSDEYAIADFELTLLPAGATALDPLS
jgi:hypothetical protein